MLKESDFIFIYLLTIISNPQLKIMITKWTQTKATASVANALVALAVIIIFATCLVIPLDKHFYQKIGLLMIVFIIGTFGLVSSSQIRYHDSQEVGAYQKIALNRELGTQIPHEKYLMNKDNKFNKQYQKLKHPTFHQTIIEKHDKEQYVHMHKLLKLRHLFNLRNNRIKTPTWKDNL